MFRNWKIARVNLGKTESANATHSASENHTKGKQENEKATRSSSSWKTVGTVEWSVLAALI